LEDAKSGPTQLKFLVHIAALFRPSDDSSRPEIGSKLDSFLPGHFDADTEVLGDGFGPATNSLIAEPKF
jgi:hypothetical protein